MTLQTSKYEPRLMDHIFCSGNSQTSRYIRWYNRNVLRLDGMAAEMSHVASVYTKPFSGAAMVFESTTGNAEWSGCNGVQINYYPLWLRHYDGDVYALRATEVDIETWPATQFINKNLHRPYESGIPGAIELITSGFSWPWWPKWARTKPTGNVHCSELIVELDQELDILDDSIEPHKFPPGLMWQHFSDKPYWQIK